MDKRFVGIVELAVYLDVSEKTVRHWIFTRKIPCYKLGRRVKFDLKQIEQWIRQKEVKILN